MNRSIESLNAFSADWSEWLWRACWQTAIVVAVAWLLGVALRRSSPWLRSWVWRLAYVKILLVLVWTTPVSLPLLPPSNHPSLAAMATSPPAPTDATNCTPTLDEPNASATIEPATTPLVADNAGADAPASALSNAIPDARAATPSAYAATDSSSRAITHEASVSEPLAGIAKLSALAWLFLAWTTGAIAVVSWFALETRRAFALYRSARRIENASLAALVATVCNQLGLKHSVQLAESDLVSGPMLVKFLRPLIVFPSGMLTNSSSGVQSQTTLNLISPSPSTGEGRGDGEAAPYAKIRPSDSEASILTHAEIRLVLAHELAHIKRHDLTWNFLSALVHAVLYFHPFVWFAHRSARQEQEMACDELVVTRLGVERHEYGQLLVKIVRQVGRQMNGAVATVGMSKSYQTLSRRIGAMGHFRRLTRRETLVAASCLALAASLALIPWRLVAQESKPARLGPIPLRPAQAPDVSSISKVEPLSDAVAEEAYRRSRESLPLMQAIDAAGKVEPLSDAAAEEAYRRSRVPWPRMQVTDAAGETVAPGNDTSPPQPAEDPQDAARRKFIVGAWRDQAGKKVIFFEDGTYDDLGVEVFVTEYRRAQSVEWPTRTNVDRARGQGDWSIRYGMLNLTNDASQRYWDKDVKTAPADERAKQCSFAIRRLDENFLRLTSQSARPVAYFLRRVDEKSADEKFAEVPAELRAFFDAAQFTPEEATTLLAYFDRYKIYKLDPAMLQTAARLQQAQRRKMTLRELFGMTLEEVSAFQELLFEHTGSKETLAELAKGEQLSTAEQSAYAKTEPFTNAFQQLADMKPGVWGHGSPPDKAVKFLQLYSIDRQFPSSDRRVVGNEQAALDKLYVYLYDLEAWYRNVVFQNHR